jgi:hypothetical protein
MRVMPGRMSYLRMRDASSNDSGLWMCYYESIHTRLWAWMVVASKYSGDNLLLQAELDSLHMISCS